MCVSAQVDMPPGCSYVKLDKFSITLDRQWKYYEFDWEFGSLFCPCTLLTEILYAVCDKAKSVLGEPLDFKIEEVKHTVHEVDNDGWNPIRHTYSGGARLSYEAGTRKIIPCPNCGKNLRVPVMDKTLEIKCPKCNKKFIL